MEKLSSSSIASNIQITHLPDSNNNNSIENKKMYLKVPHIKNFYSNISSKLKSFNICTVSKINYFMGKIIKRGKDKVEKIDQTNVVYKINCNCCDSSHVGVTKRTARIRNSEDKKQSINP